MDETMNSAMAESAAFCSQMPQSYSEHTTGECSQIAAIIDRDWRRSLTKDIRDSSMGNLSFYSTRFSSAGSEVSSPTQCAEKSKCGATERADEEEQKYQEEEQKYQTEQVEKVKKLAAAKKQRVMDKILFGTRVASSLSAKKAADKWLASRSTRRA